MKWITRMKPLVALLLCASVCLGPGSKTVTAAAGNEQGVSAMAVIQAVQARGDGERTELVIDISAPATYTSYKTAAPHRLVVDFSQVVPADALADMKLSKGPVKGITLKRFDTDAGVLTRMEIFLDQNIDPVITPSTEKIGELRVSFPGYIPPVVAKAENPVATPVEQQQQPAAVSVPAEKNEPVQPAPEQKMAVAEQPRSAELPVVTNIVSNRDGIDILVSAAVTDYKTFRLNKPERIVIDIPGVRVGMADKLVQLNTSNVSSARIAGHADKVRVVFDAVNGTLPDATIEKTATGLHIFFRAADAAKPVTATAPKAAVVQAPVPEPEKKVVSAVASEPTATAAPAAVAPKAASQIEAIDFQALDSLSRVMVTLNGTPTVENPVKTPGSISFRIKNVRLSRSLQRSFETAKFVTPVLRVTPVLVKTKTGNDVLVRVTMKEDAPFELRRDTDVIYLDIKHPADMAKQLKLQDVKKVEVQKSAPVAAKAAPAPAAPAPAAAKEPQLDKIAEKAYAADKSEYTGRKVTLEFADAEVRKIFQLLSEVSGKNFVLGDEVGGNISLKLINVPWDQALDVILDSKGFDKREEDNIVFIRKDDNFKAFDKKRVDRMNIPPNKPVTATCPVRNALATDIIGPLLQMLTKYQAMISKEATVSVSAKGTAGTISQPLVGSSGGGNESLDAQKTVSAKSTYEVEYGSLYPELNTNSIIINDRMDVIRKAESIISVLDVQKKQVMIEARMVEAETTLLASFGVQWGVNYKDGTGSILGINELGSGFGGLTTTIDKPGIQSGPGVNTGISFGTLGSNIRLDVKLSAAAEAGMAKVISSPKVVTSYGVLATIKQGSKIPYQNTTAQTGAVTQFIDAVLMLNVKPQITPSGNVLMDVNISNDMPGEAPASGGPPPISTKSANTQLTVKDGETIVIGGIYKDSESEGNSGVPYLMNTPLFGNLFKSNKKTKTKTEMLIFITPRLLDRDKQSDFVQTKCKILQ